MQVEERVRDRRRFDVWNEVPLVPQTTGMSCWAAAAAMIIGWRDAIPVNPDEVASGAGRWSEYTAGLHPTDLADFARAWRFTVEPSRSWTIEDMKALLERNGPIWLGEASPGLHSIVVTGLHGDGTADGTFARVNDPWPVERGERYTLTWSQLMKNLAAATDIAGAHPQVLHVGGRRRGTSGRFHFAERTVVRSAAYRVRSSEDSMHTALDTRHHEAYPRMDELPPSYAHAAAVAGSEYVDTVSANPNPLAGHGGTGENLYLAWNDVPDGTDAVDVVVHLHGYSSRPPDAAMLRGKVASAGVDLSGRTRPTLVVVPRGRKVTADELRANPAANPQRYTFPALTRDDGAGLERLIAFALARLGTRLGASGPLGVVRLILTAHSGGGAPLDRILGAHARRAACNPREVHVFDALYGGTSGLESWVRARIATDRPMAADQRRAEGGALRVFYRDGTATGSTRVGKALPPAGDPLHAAYRVERTTVAHGQVASTFGPSLLADASADVGGGAATSQGYGGVIGVRAYGAPIGLMEHYRQNPPEPFSESAGEVAGDIDPRLYEARSAADAVRIIADWLRHRRRFTVGVQDTTFFPHSAICKLVMNLGSATGHGTGFYVAPDRILTAAHNFVIPGRTIRSVQVAPGRTNDMSTFPSFTVTDSSRRVVHPRYAAGSGDFDLAVLKVDTPPPGGHFFDMEELRMSPQSGIAVCGYAAEGTDIDRDRQNMDIDTIRDLSAETFTYALHARHGTSGSPTFYVDGGRVRAVGVLSRTGDRYHNVGCRLTDEKIRWVRSA